MTLEQNKNIESLVNRISHTVGQYDVTLRHVIRVSGRGFLRQMGVDGRLTPLRTDFPHTKDRRVDFLAVLERAGVISQGRGRLVVHDPQALKQYVF